MRGNRTWAASIINFAVIVALLGAGRFPFWVWIIAGFAELVCVTIISGEMKWWRSDVEGKEAAIKQMMMFRDAIKNAPVVK
jgi:hypothetical protein